jgi:hypothetical protein
VKKDANGIKGKVPMFARSGLGNVRDEPVIMLVDTELNEGRLEDWYHKWQMGNDLVLELGILGRY